MYLVQFCSQHVGHAGRRIKERLVSMMDGIQDSIRICTKVKVYEDERLRVTDYDRKVVFSRRPQHTKGVYRLAEVPLYIDSRYTTIYWGGDYQLYAIFPRAGCCAWSIARHLLPVPDRLYNTTTRHVSPSIVQKTFFVDSSAKPALFDHEDLRDGQARSIHS